MIIYLSPGHGPMSNLGHERQYNPFYKMKCPFGNLK